MLQRSSSVIDTKRILRWKLFLMAAVQLTITVQHHGAKTVYRSIIYLDFSQLSTGQQSNHTYYNESD
jgi:hypothetical protein